MILLLTCVRTTHTAGEIYWKSRIRHIFQRFYLTKTFPRVEGETGGRVNHMPRFGMGLHAVGELITQKLPPTVTFLRIFW